MDASFWPVKSLMIAPYFITNQRGDGSMGDLGIGIYGYVIQTFGDQNGPLEPVVPVVRFIMAYTKVKVDGNWLA